MPVSAKL